LRCLGDPFAQTVGAALEMQLFDNARE
jgi:hypothetical protein